MQLIWRFGGFFLSLERHDSLQKAQGRFLGRAHISLPHAHHQRRLAPMHQTAGVSREIDQALLRVIVIVIVIVIVVYGYDSKRAGRQSVASISVGVP